MVKHNKIISLKLPTSLLKEIDKTARAAKVSRSFFIRKVVEKFISSTK